MDKSLHSFSLPFVLKLTASQSKIFVFFSTKIEEGDRFVSQVLEADPNRFVCFNFDDL